jgi:hypothetical protein
LLVKGSELGPQRLAQEAHPGHGRLLIVGLERLVGALVDSHPFFPFSETVVLVVFFFFFAEDLVFGWQRNLVQHFQANPDLLQPL